MELKARTSLCASGRFSHVVPIFFQICATESRRKTSTPKFAKKSISAAIALKTAGFELSIAISAGARVSVEGKTN
jgi:hypothetical protein